MVPIARIATPFALGAVLAAGALSACFIDPNPPNPHGDAGSEQPGDPPPGDPPADGGDGGTEAGP